MKSIKYKILISSVLIILIVSIFIGGSSAFLNYFNTVKTLNQSLTQAVAIASARVEKELNVYKQIVNSFALNPIFYSEDTSEKEKIVIFNELEEKFGFQTIGTTDEKGIDLENKVDYSQDDSFRYTTQNKSLYMSDPFFNEDKSSMIIMIAAPLAKSDKTVGMTYATIDAKILSDIVSSIQIGNSGNAAILNKDATTIGYKDYNLVLQQYNTNKEAANDPKLERLAEIERNMASGKTGFGEYSYDGITKFMAYTSINGTNSWSIDVAVSKREFMNATYTGIFFTILFTLLSVVGSIIIMLSISNSISNPIKQWVKRIDLLSNGDLKSELPQTKAQDEVGILAKSTANLINRLSDIIYDMTYVLQEMSDGNLNVKSEKEYFGDLIPLKISVNKISESFNEMLKKIKNSSEQVSSGSEQIASASQSLAEGATDQASSIDELSTVMQQISTQVNKSAESAKNAANFVSETSIKVQAGNKQMEQMLNAMNEINLTSNEIGNIIKTIENIASQTNLLALNASIEAARAGEAGKGFVVVADSVRDLASQTSEAVQNTTYLIEKSIKSVEDGTQIANETAQSLLTIIESSNESTKLMNEISEATIDQASSITRVNEHVEKIASVVQNNSATAEESAAASEELSSQAQILKSLVYEFKLKDI